MGLLLRLTIANQSHKVALIRNGHANEKPNGGVTHECDEPIKENL